MTNVRRVLARIALACLLGQLVTSVGVPAMLIVHAEADGLECTCSHGDHAMCPMHHRTSTRCGMRGAPDLAVVLVPALFGCTGVMPPTSAPALSLDARRAFDSVSASVIFRTSPPDGPPPRG